jgi:outer membrane protein OmpA-like peptidoglycan-associated protein
MMISMRWCPLLLLVACASSTSNAVPPPSSAEEDTEIELMTVVAEKCSIPELNTFFHFGTAQISSGHENLDKLAECLVNGPLRNDKLLLIGHTDATGPDSFNDQLGLWRAKSVGDYLIAHGVTSDRIAYQTRGKAEAKKDPKSSASDRRVDIRLLL